MYVELLFPGPSNFWSKVKWTTNMGVPYITMWDNNHLLRNIKFVIIMETLGFGPYRYCIITNELPLFKAKMMLLMAYLPRSKMCYYPPLCILTEPFLRSPWRGWALMISPKRIQTKDPLARTLFHTQQFVIYLETGYYKPMFWV